MKDMMKLKKNIVPLTVLLLCLLLVGCGGKSSSKAEPTQYIPKADDEPTSTPTDTPELTPTATPLPEVEAPTYKLVFIDHAKQYERYYSTYYFEFDEPGYYIPGSLSGASFSNAKTGAKVGKPDKVFTGEIQEEGDKTRYFCVMIFMSKNDNLATDDLSFKPEVRYRYDKSKTTKLEVEPFTVNTKKEDMNFDKPSVKSYPFCIEGEYFVQDVEMIGTHYGSPENDKTKDFCALEYYFVRLSYGDLNYETIKDHFEIVCYDNNKNLIPYIPVEGFEKYIGVSQSFEDGIRYMRVNFGLAYKKGLDNSIVNAIPNEIKKNMVLVYK